VNYFSTSANQGYEGDLEIALCPEQFKTDILGEVKDSNGALIEDSNVVPSEFALGFEIQGDQKARRTWMYQCSVTRPDVSSTTKEASIEPQTDSLAIKAKPRTTDQKVKAVLELSDSNETVYNGFFDKVYEATAA